jgi:hypothetical protein
MDDFVISNLHESRNEWCARLVTILTPIVSDGINSVFDEAWKMCKDNNEESKYLMTFQNLLSRIPKWNSVIIENECKRIIEKSGCTYLEDLITCVHIIQLKVLTCIRVGNKQKKIDISIPKLNHFVHRVYINVARKVFSNIYLFERKINDLQRQKNRREFEIMIQECILVAIRESIPTESIIRAYMDENEEQEEETIIEPIAEGKEDGKEEVKEEVKEEGKEEKNNEDLPPVLGITDKDEEPVITRLTFNDVDSVSDGTTINAPKSIEKLEEKEVLNELMNKEKEDEEDIDMNGNNELKIHDNVSLDDILDLEDESAIALDGVEDL